MDVFYSDVDCVTSHNIFGQKGIGDGAPNESYITFCRCLGRLKNFIFLPLPQNCSPSLPAIQSFIQCTTEDRHLKKQPLIALSVDCRARFEKEEQQCEKRSLDQRRYNEMDIIIIIIHKLIGRPDLTGLAHRGANTARQSGRFLYGKNSLSKTLAK